MVKYIEYRDGNNWHVGYFCPSTPMTRDEGVAAARRGLDSIELGSSAHVFATDDRGGIWAGGSETVISTATEWQKRNG